MATYRELTPDEMPTAVRLWVEVFGVEAPFFQSLLDGGDADDFSVGAFDGDQLVSSVHVFMRWFRDRAGRPLKVGGIGSVSTLPEARKKGHSGHLLQLAIKGMEDRGCDWSALGTGVNDHYARYGWQTVSTRAHRGLLRQGVSSETLNPTQIDDSLLDEMMRVYDVHSVSRPMANVRSPKLWRTAVRYRISRSFDEVYVAREGDGIHIPNPAADGPLDTTKPTEGAPSSESTPGQLKAYLVTRRWENRLEFIEGECEQGAGRTLVELVRRRLSAAAQQGVVSVAWSMPEPTNAFDVFRDACSEVWPVEDRGYMVRVIGDRMSMPDLVAILADPIGRKSDLDSF